LLALQSQHKPQTSDSRICREGVADSDYAPRAHATRIERNIGAIRGEFLAAELKFLPLCLGIESFAVSLLA